MSEEFTRVSLGTSAFFYSLYALSSVCMTIFNKSVIKEFAHPRILLVAQNVATVVFILVGALVIVPQLKGLFKTNGKVISVQGGDSVENNEEDDSNVPIYVKRIEEYFYMKPFKVEHIYYCIPITVSFLLMLLSSLKALSLVSVPTVVVFRNVATLFIGIGDVILYGKQFTTKQIISLFIIALGAFIYAYNDISGTIEGYIWIGINTGAVILNSLLEKYITVNITQTAVGITCYQNGLSIIVMTVMIFVAGEAVTESISSLPFSIKAMFLLTCVFGTTIGISYFSLNKFASPTSITVAGNMNKLISVMVGTFVFADDLMITAMVGLLVCMSGGLYYSFASIWAKEAPTPAVLPMDDKEEERYNQ